MIGYVCGRLLREWSTIEVVREVCLDYGRRDRSADRNRIDRHREVLGGLGRLAEVVEVDADALRLSRAAVLVIKNDAHLRAMCVQAANRTRRKLREKEACMASATWRSKHVGNDLHRTDPGESGAAGPRHCQDNLKVFTIDMPSIYLQS